MSWFSKLLRGCIGILYLVVCLRFFVRLFEPGNSDSGWFFDLIHPVVLSLDSLLLWVLIPAVRLSGWLQSVLPAALQVWFPAFPTAQLFEAIGDTLRSVPALRQSPVGDYFVQANFRWIFPGLFDWNYLLTLILLVLLESLLNGVDFALGRGLHRWKIHRGYLKSVSKYNTEIPGSYDSLAVPSGYTPLPAGKRFEDPMGRAEVRTLISDMREETKGLQRRVNRDALTNLYNKGYFLSNLKAEIDLAKKRKTPVSLVMLDVDDFKQINDQYGHPVGDQVLIEIARTLNNAFTYEGTCCACRYGGEEMAVVLGNVLPQVAEEYAETVRQLIMQIQVSSVVNHQFSASIGVITIRFNSPTFNSYDAASLISKTDELMYQSKQQGKNRVTAQRLGY